MMWPHWVNILAGIWLILAPFLLGYRSVMAARWNDMVIGVIVVVCAWYAMSIRDRDRVKNK